MKKFFLTMILFFFLTGLFFAVTSIHFPNTDYGIGYCVHQLYNTPLNTMFPPPQLIVMDVYPAGSTIYTGDGQANLIIDARYNGWYIASPNAHVFTASSSGTPTVQIRNVTTTNNVLKEAPEGRMIIDINEYDTVDGASQPSVNTLYNQVATKDQITIDVDVAGTGTCGLQVRFLLQIDQIACLLKYIGKTSNFGFSLN